MLYFKIELVFKYLLVYSDIHRFTSPCSFLLLLNLNSNLIVRWYKEYPCCCWSFFKIRVLIATFLPFIKFPKFLIPSKPLFIYSYFCSSTIVYSSFIVKQNEQYDKKNYIISCNIYDTKHSIKMYLLNSKKKEKKAFFIINNIFNSIKHIILGNNL